MCSLMATEVANGLERLVELDLAAIDFKALGFELGAMSAEVTEPNR
jgi:hypothetical protein